MRKSLFVISMVLFAFGTFSVIADEAPTTDVPAVQQAEQQEEVQAAEAAQEAEAVESCSEESLDSLIINVDLFAFEAAAGQSCGGAICGKFEYCCNPSCSICVPFGMSCTQEACN